MLYVYLVENVSRSCTILDEILINNSAAIPPDNNTFAIKVLDHNPTKVGVWVMPIPSGKLFSTVKKLPDVIPITAVIEEFGNVEFFFTKIIKLRKELLTQTTDKMHSVVCRTWLVVGDDLHWKRCGWTCSV